MSDTDRSVEKAYHNEAFLNSRDARTVRILSEYLEPEARFERLGVKGTVVFFGSARIPSPEEAKEALARAEGGDGDVARARSGVEMSHYYACARELSARLSRWASELEGQHARFVVCTGGGPGIMEAANRGARDAGALSIGLTISIPRKEFENTYVSPELAFQFHYFFMRKFWFTYLAKAVVVMPGGFGTFDELFEIMTLIQTLKMKKRLPVVLFGREFWDEALSLEALVKWGTIDASDPDLFYRTDSTDEAFEFLTRELADHAMARNGPSL